MYDRSFVMGLRHYVNERRRNNPDFLTPSLPLSVRKIRDFDAHITAPLSGFANADDYYSQASSGPYLTKIRIPTMIVAAKDDPIVPITMVQESKISDAVKLVIADGGGHLGYVAARSKDPDCRWLDWRVVDWTLAHMPGPLVSANWRLTRPSIKTMPGVQHSV
jgi:predicted alpha/beta-fold hydrolase